MIDRAVFTVQLSLREGHYGRTISQEVGNYWYDTLNARLDTSQFLVGIQMCLARREFLPTPTHIIEFAIGTPTMRAEQAWAEIQRSIRAADDAKLDDLAREALKLHGGSFYLASLDHKSLGFVRRAYIESYVALDAQRELDETWARRGLPMKPAPALPPSEEGAGIYRVLNPARRTLDDAELDAIDAGRADPRPLALPAPSVAPFVLQTVPEVYDAAREAVAIPRKAKKSTSSITPARRAEIEREIEAARAARDKGGDA